MDQEEKKKSNIIAIENLEEGKKKKHVKSNCQEYLLSKRGQNQIPAHISIIRLGIALNY